MTKFEEAAAERRMTKTKVFKGGIQFYYLYHDAGVAGAQSLNAHEIDTFVTRIPYKIHAALCMLDALDRDRDGFAHLEGVGSVLEFDSFVRYELHNLPYDGINL